MRARLKDDDGITLIELLVASILSIIVLTAAGGVLISLLSTPPMVTGRVQAAGAGQLAVRSIETGVRNSSDFRLTSPTGNDQLLVARTAQKGSSITWLCTAWYYSASDGSISYTTSATAIPAVPTATDLASWTTLDTSVSPKSGTGIFTASGEVVTVAYTIAVPNQAIPQTMMSSVASRAGSTGSPACY